VCLYVDDLFITCKAESIAESLIARLVKTYKEVTVNRGPKHSYLGMTFDFGVKAGAVRITMEKFIADLLKYYKVTGTAATPASDLLFDIRESDLLPDDMKIEFHSCTAKLLYLCIRARPDIMLPTIFLTGRVRNPTADDWGKLQRVLKYLNSEPDLGVTIHPDSALNIRAYIDASFGVHPDWKGHTGSVIMMDKGSLFARSVKQKIVTKSSTECEIVGVSDGLSQVIWTRDFLLAQGHKMAPATLYQDNTSTMAMIAKGRATSERTRHVHIRYFFVKDRVDAGEIVIEHMPTKSMVADILTKPLQGELFREMRDALLNCRDV
jgi:hypothetical protein